MEGSIERRGMKKWRKRREAREDVDYMKEDVIKEGVGRECEATAAVMMAWNLPCYVCRIKMVTVSFYHAHLGYP